MLKKRTIGDDKQCVDGVKSESRGAVRAIHVLATAYATL